MNWECAQNRRSFRTLTALYSNSPNKTQKKNTNWKELFQHHAINVFHTNGTTKTTHARFGGTVKCILEDLCLLSFLTNDRVRPKRRTHIHIHNQQQQERRIVRFSCLCLCDRAYTFCPIPQLKLARPAKPAETIMSICGAGKTDVIAATFESGLDDRRATNQRKWWGAFECRAAAFKRSVSPHIHGAMHRLMAGMCVCVLVSPADVFAQAECVWEVECRCVRSNRFFRGVKIYQDIQTSFGWIFFHKWSGWKCWLWTFGNSISVWRFQLIDRLIGWLSIWLINSASTRGICFCMKFRSRNFRIQGSYLIAGDSYFIQPKLLEIRLKFV